MRRIIINCLLLASIASAVPDGRQKRSFSYIKNLITSTLFGGSQRRNPTIEQDTEYKLYKVPGYDEVLIKGTSRSSILEGKIKIKPEDVTKINPFESFIGTENSQDTLMTLQNLNNLLSTGILNRQEINALKETMVPMISHLDSVNVRAEEAVPVIPETIQPSLAEVVKPVEVKVKLEEPFPTRYSYKQMEKNEPVMTFSARSNPEISVTQRFARSPSLPLCIQQRIDGVVSLGATPFQMSPIKSFPIETHEGIYGQYPIAINRFPPSVSDDALKVNLFQQSGYGYSKNPYQKNEPMNRLILPLAHLSDLNHIHAVNKGTLEKPYRPNLVQPKPVTLSDKIHVSQILGPIPPQYISSFNDKMPKALKLGKDSETNDVNIIKTTDSPNCNGLHISKALDSKAHGTNIIKSEDNVAKINTVPQLSYQQTTHNNPDGIAKEKEGLKSDIHTDSPLLNQYVYMPPIINFNPVSTESVGIAKVPDIAKYNNNETDVINMVKTAENVPGKETTSHISHEQASCGNGNALGILQDKDALKPNVNTNTPWLNPVNANGANITDSNVTTNDSKTNITNIPKTVDNSPQNDIASHNSYNQISPNNPNSTAKEKNELETSVSTDILLRNKYVYIPPRMNKNSDNMNGANIDTDSDRTAITNESKKKNKNILTTVDDYLPRNETTSRYSPDDPSSTFSIVKEKDELETNVNTDIPLSNQYINIPHSVNKNLINMNSADIDTGADSTATTNDSEKNFANIPKAVDHLPQDETHNSSNNPNITFSIVKEKDDLETNVNTDIPLSNQYINIPHSVNKNLINMNSADIDTGADSTATTNDSEKNFANIPKAVDNLPRDEIHNSSNNSNITFSIVKEKDELKTNVKTDIPLSSVNKNPVNIDGPDTRADIILKTNESEANIVKPARNVTEKETLSEYISVRESQSHPNEFKVDKEKEELKTNLNPGTPLQNHHVHIPPHINTTPVVMHDSNIVKTVEPEPEKGTLSYYIYKQLGHDNPPAFSMLDDKDEPKTNVHTDSPLISNRVHISPHGNITPVKTNIANIVKQADSAPKDRTVFHYVYKQASHNNPNAFSMVKEGDELKTNVNTDVPKLSHNTHVLFNVNTEPVSYTTVKDGLFTNEVITNSESETESTSTKSINENSPALKENTRFSFKDNPFVVANGNYLYRQNNADGSSMSVKGDKDGVSVNVNEKPSTGRGDIPGQ